ncbi:FAD-binding oxidoreductase [Actinoallomurus vinaceus]|uniref:FAD-binding oxidoreductase n=1 Tax=Actinoallomurus vinaceus TaxID=1080074 RepID=A0ABP8UN72_9ACTN
MGQQIERLRERVRGRVITAEDAGYDEARRVYNAMIDRRPLVVVRCADAGDAMATVDFARENDLVLSVRGGSHSVPGYGTNDGGVVLDLSSMRGVRVDPRTRTARAEGGCTWGDFNHATHAYGLATTGGIISTTGIGGLTLGGGIGYLSRRCGLTIDNLISADVVTADGRFLVASEKEYEDLFWALRGGGGNFGVVTSFEYRLHPVENIFAGIFFYPLDRARDVLEFYRDHIKEAPEELGCYPAFQITPPLPFIPESEQATPHCAMVACWSGPLDEGERALRPIRTVAPTVGELVAPMPYPMINSALDALVPRGLQHYWKTAFATELTDGAIAAHLQHGPGLPAVNSTVHIYPINGACHRVPAGATAFTGRDMTFATVIAGMWPDPSANEGNIAWVRDYFQALRPHSASGGYVNFMSEDDRAHVRDDYRDAYARLASIKKAYDPGNLFRLNQNIEPAG